MYRAVQMLVVRSAEARGARATQQAVCVLSACGIGHSTRQESRRVTVQERVFSGPGIAIMLISRRGAARARGVPSAGFRPESDERDGPTTRTGWTAGSTRKCTARTPGAA